jgi:exopolysaccharide production protein ExoZ
MKNDKLPGLQIARAVAALSIMYFHSWTVLDRFPKGTAHPIYYLSEYGWLGVDLFFAISGFVICLVVSRQKFGVASFLIKRVFRLYPLWIVTLSVFAVLTLLWRAPIQSETLGYFFYSATLLPTEHYPFYDIGGSLQHEMIFYVLAVVLVPLFGLYGLAAFLLVSTIAYHMLEMPWYLSNPAMYHAEFLAGVTAFIARPHLTRLGSILPVVLGAVALAFVLLRLGRQYVPIPLFLLIVGFANAHEGKARSLVVLGSASYSIYLLHPVVFSVAKALTTWVPKNDLWIEEFIRFGSIAIVLAMALASWRYFEQPVILLGNRIAGKLARESLLPSAGDQRATAA